MNDEDEKESICLNCLYGCQPHGYYPIICVHGRRIREMWHDVFTCRNFAKCPDPPEPTRQEPFQVIVNNR